MATPEKNLDKASKAVMHLIRRIRKDEKMRYYLGFGTESFELLTEAAAEITGKSVEEVKAWAMNAEIIFRSGGNR